MATETEMRQLLILYNDMILITTMTYFQTSDFVNLVFIFLIWDSGKTNRKVKRTVVISLLICQWQLRVGWSNTGARIYFRLPRWVAETQLLWAASQNGGEQKAGIRYGEVELEPQWGDVDQDFLELLADSF